MLVRSLNIKLNVDQVEYSVLQFSRQISFRLRLRFGAGVPRDHLCQLPRLDGGWDPVLYQRTPVPTYRSRQDLRIAVRSERRLRTV